MIVQGFALVICTQIFWSIRVNSLNLNAQEYQNCTFHLVDSDPKNHGSTNDLIERILVTNQLDQQWTVTNVLGSDEVHPDGDANIGIPKYFDETCSVNILIVIQLKECYSRLLTHMYGSRLYTLRNKFLFIYRHNSTCRENPTIIDVAEEISPIPVDLYFIYLRTPVINMNNIFHFEENFQVELTQSICTSCAKELKCTVIPIPLPSLLEMSKISEVVSVKSRQPFLAVIGFDAGRVFKSRKVSSSSFLYKLRSVTVPKKVGDVPAHLYVHREYCRKPEPQFDVYSARSWLGIQAF